MKRGTRLRRIRQYRGIPVPELAKAVGIAPMTLYRYEQGARIPRMDIVVKLAEVLHCNVSDLIGTSTTPNQMT